MSPPPTHSITLLSRMSSGIVSGGLPAYKTVLLGETAVGKSSIAVRFVRDQFFDYQESTIGAAFLAESLTIPETGEIVRFEIWDTAGQERYHSLAPMYYRGAKAALVVYDITDAKSFQKATMWVNELKQQCGQDLVLTLVGNKIDLEKDRDVNRSEAIEYATANRLLHIETSAKSNINVHNLFLEIGKRLVQATAAASSANMRRAAPNGGPRASDGPISLRDQRGSQAKKKGGCC